MTDKFPDNFMWGASTSAYQVEGGNRFNNWWEWEQAGNSEPSGAACDHYHRFKEDFLLAKELGHNAHRLGIEWSRLEKEEGVWDQAEWDHYKKVLDELAGLGMEPVVTLNHFTIPAWFARKGGWMNDGSVGLFTRFAAKAIEELGGRARYWVTINEPQILAMLAYSRGQWPPCERRYDHALAVLRNMLKSHVKAYLRMHELAKGSGRIKPPKIGIAKAVTAFHPCRWHSPLDRLCASWRNRFHNHGFIASAINGRVLIPGLRREKLPVKNAMDFIGLNYYFRQFIRHQERGQVLTFHKNVKCQDLTPFGYAGVCPLDHHPEAGQATDMGWEIYPPGIYEVTKSLSRYRLPIIITENGLATGDDTVRQRYIKDHLTQLARAIAHGAPVIGYLHWSLLDNFEWDSGYTKRFGLIGINYATQKRTIRNSARYYASVIKAGSN